MRAWQWGGSSPCYPGTITPWGRRAVSGCPCMPQHRAHNTPVQAHASAARLVLVASPAFPDPMAWHFAWAGRAREHAASFHPPIIIDLHDLLQRADAADRLAACDAAIILCDASDPPAVVLQAMARIRESDVACMVLRRACSPEDRRRLSIASMEVHDAAADAAFTAGLLIGLVRSRETVHAMQAELDLAHRAHRQAEGWLVRADDEMRLAAKLQRDMLPARFPEVPGLAFGAHFRSAYYVGGDVYRVWRLDERRVGLFIADAMGHGVRAAMQSMILAHALVLKETAAAGYRLVSPGDALARLNTELLREQHEVARFATAAVAVIDAQSGEVALASAGHPAALLLAGGSVTAIAPEGPALGAFDDAAFPETRFMLTPGSTLVLHTDGLDAAANAAAGLDPLFISPADSGQIASLIALDTAGPLDPALSALSGRIDGLTGSLHAPDDIAVLAVRRT